MIWYPCQASLQIAMVHSRIISLCKIGVTFCIQVLASWSAHCSSFTFSFSMHRRPPFTNHIPAYPASMYQISRVSGLTCQVCGQHATVLIIHWCMSSTQRVVNLRATQAFHDDEASFTSDEGSLTAVFCRVGFPRTKVLEVSCATLDMDANCGIHPGMKVRIRLQTMKS